ncbi:hypothetical protein AWV79_34200 [Cupriavidus sp. UYMMa02A]|nr:hypothetical protein AWV79_34200 [Cupriavidus sp. UYMMa02A]
MQDETQRKRQQWSDIFVQSSAAWTLLLVMAHQGIVAASSLFLTRTIETFQIGGAYRPYLLLYVVTMLVPYLPGCVSQVTLQQWINQAHRRFASRLASTAYGRVDKYHDSALRETVESVLSRNSFLAIKDYLTFIHAFMGFALNSALSMLVLSALLPGHLAGGYLASLALSLVLILILRRTIRRHSAKAENDFIRYSESLHRGWDNSTLGNRYNFEFWQLRCERDATQYYRQSNHLQWLKQGGNLLLAMIALLPTVYLMLAAIAGADPAPALVAAIIVNLTRVFHILGSLSALVYQMLDLSAMNARLRVLFDAERSLWKRSPFPDCPSGSITMNGAQVTDYRSAATTVCACDRGRFTVCGDNGAGKSTLLSTLKQRLGDDAILIPAQHGKLEWQHPGASCPRGKGPWRRWRKLLRRPLPATCYLTNGTRISIAAIGRPSANC